MRDLRYGLALSTGSTYVAAVPAGVEDPTITYADGATRVLHPNADGIVVSDALQPGAIVTRHGTDGTVDTSPVAR